MMVSGIVSASEALLVGGAFEMSHAQEWLGCPILFQCF